MGRASGSRVLAIMGSSTIMAMMFVLIIIAVPLIAVWMISFLVANDLSIPTCKIKAKQKVLVIFPHADDETNVAGILRRLVKQQNECTLLLLTKGERGTTDARLNSSLKTIRVKEAQSVSQILGIHKLMQEDLGDGTLSDQPKKVKACIDKTLHTLQPDIVISYDRAGMYGHADHILCSEAVGDLIRLKYPKTALWYVSFPKRLLALMDLPEHMAKDPAFKQKQSTPNARVFIGWEIPTKLHAIYAYKSQLASFKKSMPWNLPIWVIYSVQLFEYIEKVN